MTFFKRTVLALGLSALCGAATLGATPSTASAHHPYPCWDVDEDGLCIEQVDDRPTETCGTSYVDDIHCPMEL